MKTYIKKSVIMASVAVAVFSAAPVYATNGYFSHGYSTKEKGLAGAGAAYSQDALASATNPAGLAFVGDRMDVGLQLFSPKPRSYTVTGAPSYYLNGSTGQFSFGIGTGNQSIESNNNLFLIPSFGYSKALDSVSSVGIAVYGNGGMNTQYKGGVAALDCGAVGGTPGQKCNPPGTFGAGTTGVNLEQLFVNGSYAYKVNDKSAVGASLIFAFQRFTAQGLDMFGGFSSDPTKLSGNRKSDSTGFGFKLGYQGEVAPGIRLGASYQSKMSMSKFSEYKGLFANGGQFNIPSTYTVGMEFDAGPTGKVVADVQKINYSKVDSIANPIGNLMTACKPSPTGGTGSGCLGGSNGAGFGWKDMTIVKLGYQWRTDNTDWRVGASHGKQPIPSSQVMFNILAPAVIETHFTFGMTKQMPNNQEFNLAAMYAPSHEISGPNPFDQAQTIKLKMSEMDLQVGWAWKY